MPQSSVLHFETCGNPSGPTLIFLHALGTSGWMWHKQIELLSNFNCVVPDLPGHGKSNHIPWRSFSETALLIRQIVQSQTDLEKAHIVGLSLGAYVGLQLLSESPSIVKRAILSGLHVLPMPHKQLMLLMPYVLAPFIKSGFMVRLNAKALNIPEAQFEDYRHSFQQMSIPTFIKASRDASSFTMPENITSISTPTLILAGENEHSLIHQSQQVLNKKMANVQSYIVPNVGHGWNLEAPNLFAKTVRDWVQQHPLPAQLQTIR
ncbi:MAG: alpha/beta hydrolase [Leptolyngbya sp. SIO1D8]|nr:alpha/beta hydrolase [Leptolyngbya sp. SIO1D8]